MAQETIDFEVSVASSIIVGALLDAKLSDDLTLDVLAAKGPQVMVELTVGIPTEETLEHCSDAALREEFEDRKQSGSQGWNLHHLSEGIGYVKSGQLGLAGAMFARVFEGADLHQIERAFR